MRQKYIIFSKKIQKGMCDAQSSGEHMAFQFFIIRFKQLKKGKYHDNNISWNSWISDDYSDFCDTFQE